MGASKKINICKDWDAALELWVTDEYVDIIEYEVHDAGGQFYKQGICVNKQDIPALIKSLQEAYEQS